MGLSNMQIGKLTIWISDSYLGIEFVSSSIQHSNYVVIIVYQELCRGGTAGFKWYTSRWAKCPSFMGPESFKQTGN